MVVLTCTPEAANNDNNNTFIRYELLALPLQRIVVFLAYLLKNTSKCSNLTAVCQYPL